jgi:hypothetical protein
MTRSIFDPDGGETEHSGSTHMGPDASNISHLPPDLVDGEAEADDDEAPAPLAADADEAARRLREMAGEDAPFDVDGGGSLQI